MASCSKCGKNVGCGCNLVNGLCLGCVNQNVAISDSVVDNTNTYSNIVRYSQPDAPPVQGFEQILQTPGLTQEEKIKRINDILEQARQQL